jgi:hypothetical protein
LFAGVSQTSRFSDLSRVSETSKISEFSTIDTLHSDSATRRSLADANTGPATSPTKVVKSSASKGRVGGGSKSNLASVQETSFHSSASAQQYGKSTIATHQPPPPPPPGDGNDDAEDVSGVGPGYIDVAASSPAQQAPWLVVGARVVVTGRGPGVVRWMGRTGGDDRIGVELDEPNGLNDGSTPKGRVLFRCPPKHGVFVLADKVQQEPANSSQNEEQFGFAAE